jgi:23S rRNA (cytidine1920-2'-O)/16S rRNA (cytidine1409-2'-O)-methyltransferase
MTRLDLLLVERGLYATRARARDAIRRGTVRVDGRIAEKPGTLVASGAAIAIDDPAQGFVSRGALKLAHALDHFGLSPQGANCLDIGASTGGFSEVLLRRGARSVTAIDVGHGQLASVVADDPRVTALAGVNARHLTEGHLTVAPDFIVADVSFISLRLALPPALKLAEPRCTLVVLVKPQFELSRAALSKGGMVRDPAAQQEAVAAVRAYCLGADLRLPPTPCSVRSNVQPMRRGRRAGWRGSWAITSPPPGTAAPGRKAM